jgi:hypothetical protein
VAWIVDDTGFPKERAGIRSASLVNTAVKWVSRITAVPREFVGDDMEFEHAD